MRRLKKLSKSHSVTGTSENDAAATTTAAAAAAATVTDTNGGSTATSPSKENLLNTDIFKHFDKTGRSELYVYTPQIRLQNWLWRSLRASNTTQSTTQLHRTIFVLILVWNTSNNNFRIIQRVQFSIKMVPSCITSRMPSTNCSGRHCGSSLRRMSCCTCSLMLW